jgi:S-adenosylmethionine:tRNA ribosyltransferase-isomerase
MLLSDFDYELPPAQIAQNPLACRDGSRLLLAGRVSGQLQDRLFSEFADLLAGNELLVLNNARVIPARLLGHRAGSLGRSPSPGGRGKSPSTANITGGDEIEILLSRPLEEFIWEALVRPGKKMPVGQKVLFGEGELEAEVLARGEHGHRTLRFISHDKKTLFDHLDQIGHIPLPPYIDRSDNPSDSERYQTVFARTPGAIAAPTAGLHFTSEILERIRRRGIEICEITLHVGLGTFLPIREETLEAHVMHSECYEIPSDSAERIAQAKKDCRPIVAIGTTAVRALEDAALRAVECNSQQLLIPGKGEARLFITPGFSFRVTDALLTNFHLPKSTLLALVCAFAGRENILAAYRHAVAANYRFYSYGDCMLIR